MRNIIIEKVLYTEKPEKVQTLMEHVVQPNDVLDVVEQSENINVFLDGDKIYEEDIKAFVPKKEFKELFGPNKKPKKGDIVSIDKLSKKFKVKKSKKYTARKKGKGYKLNLGLIKE